MTVLQAIILGIVQGLTEFIPVSSTAHLVIASRLIGLYAGVDPTLRAQQTTATIAVVQLGTLLAVLIYFAHDIVNITRAFVADHLALLTGSKTRPDGRAIDANQPGISGVQRPSLNTSPRLSQDAWLGWLVIIGSIPVAI
ncbi:MAG: undecaprenyl-diphosphate phosphatase, partial [bacterium]